MMNPPFITSYYCRPLSGPGGYASYDPLYLGPLLPGFAVWLMQKAYDMADGETAGVTVAFKIAQRSVMLEIKAPEWLYEEFRGDPAYYERLN